MLCGHHFLGDPYDVCSTLVFGMGGESGSFFAGVLDPADIAIMADVSPGRHVSDRRRAELHFAIRDWTINGSGSPECLDCLYQRRPQLRRALDEAVTAEARKREQRRTQDAAYAADPLPMAAETAFDALFLAKTPSRQEVVSARQVLARLSEREFITTALARFRATRGAPVRYTPNDWGSAGIAGLIGRLSAKDVYWFGSALGLTTGGRFVYVHAGGITGGSYQHGGQGYVRRSNYAETIRGLNHPRPRGVTASRGRARCRRAVESASRGKEKRGHRSALAPSCPIWR
jgi:hypothetical protein